MDLSLISNLRLSKQSLVGSCFTSVQELLSYFGAIQAQDYSMAKWAVGCRIPGITHTIVENAINNCEILRTHVLRPTWHFVSANDIWWMLELTGAKILASTNSRHMQLELDKSTILKGLSIIEKSLSDVDFLTKETLGKKLQEGGITITNERLSHLMFCAELNMLLCNGPVHNGKHSYALLEKRVPTKKKFDKELALSMLTKKYFQSHGPATIDDFKWWSGLNIREIKIGLELNRKKLEEHNGYYYETDSVFPLIENSMIFLPAFDEYLISYKNRDACIAENSKKAAITKNGIFKPIIVFNGKVIGIWKRINKGEELIITTFFFEKPNEQILALVEPAAQHYANFIGKKKFSIHFQ